MIAKDFIAAYQQVGDFRAVEINGQISKNGGNVASHFLTPDGHVLHSVTGPVNARTLIDETEFALALNQEIQGKSVFQRGPIVSIAHQQASYSSQLSQNRQVHELYTRKPLPLLQEVYREIFEKILGQKVSDAGPRLAQAAERIQYAKRNKRPILFVLHDVNQWRKPAYGNSRLSPISYLLMNEFVVVSLPLDEAPALSQITKQPPFKANGMMRPLFVVTDSNCEQLSSVAGWNARELATCLANGWADVLHQHTPSVRSLVSAQRILRKADPSAAERVKKLTIKTNEQNKQRRAQQRRDVRI